MISGTGAVPKHLDAVGTLSLLRTPAAESR